MCVRGGGAFRSTMREGGPQGPLCILSQAGPVNDTGNSGGDGDVSLLSWHTAASGSYWSRVMLSLDVS